MSIDKLGESLLSGVRERNDRIAAESRRRDRKEALILYGSKALMSIGNSFLRNKAERFADKQEILGSQALFKDATNAASSVMDEHTAMMKSEKGKVNPVEYEKDLLRPTFEAQFKMNADPSEVGTTAYQQLVEKELTTIAKQRVDKRNEILSAAKKLKSTEEFNLDAANAIRSAKSLTVGGAVTNAITGLFEGTSRADREQLAIKAIQENDPNRKRVLTLMEEYNKTKNLVTAYDYANVIVPKTPKEERFITEKTFELKEVGGVLYTITKEKKKDKFNILGDTEAKPVIEAADTKQMGSVVLKSMQSNFNFATQARTVLNPDYLKEFASKVGSENIQLTNIKTTDEYVKVSEIFQTFMEQDGALKDSYKDDLSKTLLNALVTNNMDVADAIENKDINTATKILEELGDIAYNFRSKL
jgi:hypothetical protein